MIFVLNVLINALLLCARHDFNSISAKPCEIDESGIMPSSPLIFQHLRIARYSIVVLLQSLVLESGFMLCFARGRLSGLIPPGGRTAALHPAGNNSIRIISPVQGISRSIFVSGMRV